MEIDQIFEYSFLRSQVIMTYTKCYFDTWQLRKTKDFSARYTYNIRISKVVCIRIVANMNIC